MSNANPNSNPTSNRDRLNLYIHQLHQRLRLGVSLRGVAILTATALITTVFLVLILNRFAFPVRGLIGARSLLLMVIAGAAGLALALPLLRLTRRRATVVAESAHPEFQQRLLTFDDRETKGNDPFLELLAADTLSVARDAQPANLLPNNKLYFLAGAGLACVAVLVWLVAAGPGYLGYGASLLWTGPKAVPLYDIKVTPGDVAVRRNADQLITAHLIGLTPEKVRLFARYKSSQGKAGWEPVAMQPTDPSDFQFLFAGLPEDVEYYVEAGPLTSRHYKVRVVDLPSVKQMRVTYHYPKWTGIQPVTEEHGGDLRAIEGTNAELTVRMDRPLRNGQLTLDDGKQITLSGGEGNVYKGSILMQKDGAYHVAALDQGQPVRLSEDYFIATDKANPPEIAIDRPTGDYRASPIEEVTVGVKASDEFGLNKVSLHYSVNGGPEKIVELPQQPGAKNVSGSTTLSLEDFKLIPGDLVSLYATAKDGHAEARTDMAFIQADPFEREFSQSQQMGGGGGGGGGMGNQTDISKREKELIAATWKRQNDKAASAKDSAEAGKFLSSVQTKLQEQALSLAARMDSRDLSSANEEFNSFGHDMQAAAAAMTPSSEKLKETQWHDAIPAEQKALQYLLRAEATFRKIQVAFGQQRGGGGGGGGGAGRDLASLFDLELDTEKNQYETAQTGSAADQKAKAVDDALAKLDALARRQEELAQQQRNHPQTMQERWQQEMLRREAEELQRQMEQMAQNGQQNGQQSQEGQQSQQGQQGQKGQQGQQGQQSGQQGQQSASGSSGGSSSGGSSGQSGQSQSARSRGSQSNGSGDAADPRVTQALNRLRNADQEMKRSAGQEQSSEAARRAADQLRQAAGLMSSTQQQQASGKLDSLARESDRLSKEEHGQADRIRSMTGQAGASNQEQYEARLQQRNKLAEDRQQLSDDLSQLEKNLRNSARELAPSQPQAASKLRDALGGMDQTDLTNRTQRTADWLRRGINPNSNGTEEGISKGLDQLSQQVHQAQQGLGPGKPGQGQGQGGEQTAALDHVERFRDQVESLTARGQNPLGRQAGQQPGQSGQPGQRQGQQPGQGGQPGQRQGQWSAQGGQGAQIAEGNGGNQRGGNQVAQGNLSGDVGNWRSGGGAEGTAWNNINTGNNHFDRSRGPAAPDNTPVPADPERTFQQGMGELNQLRHLAQNDPAALKEVQDLVREMQRLDPRRFPGNPAMVEQLHTEVLAGVDRLELQLRHDSDGQTPGEVRTTKESAIPPGYEEAVAEYYRRLSKGQ
jgi:hypothetical protein